MKRWWRSHSVRVRLTLWYVATMILVLGVYASVIFLVVSRTASESLEAQLRRDFQLAAATIYRAPDGSLTWDEPEQIVPEQDPLWVQVWSGDGRQLLFRSSEAERLPVPESQALATQLAAQSVTVPGESVPTRILSHLSGFSAGAERFVIQVGRSEGPMRDDLRQLMLILVLGLPLAVAIAGLGGYTLARRALAPVERMTERAQSITAERLGDRLPVDNPDDEMGRLARVFNETLGRLQASFDQMRRFTADVSHELRTPLTSIRSVGEVGLREHRDDAEYRGIIGSMLEEADRLASLVDRLLTLSRAESGQAKLSIEEVSLLDLADNVAAHLGVLAEEKRQSIVVDGRGAPHARSRPAGASAGAHQPRRQRDQVQSVRRTHQHPRLRNGGFGDHRRHRQRHGDRRRALGAHLRSVLSGRRRHGAGAWLRTGPLDCQVGGRSQRRSPDARSSPKRPAARFELRYRAFNPLRAGARRDRVMPQEKFARPDSGRYYVSGGSRWLFR